ncbi:MAG: TrmH family RNA methyltransferase [Paludibacteraceae bacterium]|nr:TrmH family RNA methyltransferase [Paludibacteraceae bacterium]
MNRLTPEAFHEAEKLPLVVVLDNVRSQHNIGAVFRTADAMCLERVVLCGICCCPPNQEIHKTALGAEQTVAWQYYADTLEAVRDLQAEGYTCYAVEQAHNSLTLEQVAEQITNHKSPITNCPKMAIILGHEVFGVQQEVIDLCGQCIEIPQYGTKHSMNVSVTAGIVMYRLSGALRAVKAL